MSGNTKDFKVKNGIQPTVYQEGVGTVVSGSVGYSLAAASPDNKSFSVSSQDSEPQGLYFKPDGTKVYILGNTNDTVFQYTLSTAWDLSTASYDNKSFSISSQGTFPYGLAFKTDGTKMYRSDYLNDAIYQYSLSTAWDISTASYDSKSLSISSQEGTNTSLFFKSDGTSLYILGQTNDTVFQYTLSTAWDVSTGSYASKSLNVSSQITTPTGLYFKGDGSEMYAIGSGSVFKYLLGTAWDVSTASYSSDFYTFTSINSPVGVTLKDDGTKLYTIGNNPDTIHQYSTVLTTASLDLSTGSVFEVTPTSDIQVTLTNPAASGTSSGATLLLDGGSSSGYDLGNAVYSNKSINVSSLETTPRGVAFNSDGTKLYMIGSATDNIYQYSLSTAFDLDTAVYDSVNFSVASQATNPYGLAFNNDGTKLYVLGLSNGRVYQYSLSTAFDLSTASYDSVSFSISSQDSSTGGISFNSSGTKLYTIGAVTDSVYQYSLSTAFDLSTASYDSVSFSVASQDTAPAGIAFNTDGTKLYMLGNTNDSVYQYSLSTAFDLSTASYDSVSFSVTGQETTPQDITFSNDGKSLYLTGAVTDTIHQYSTATPATITYDSALQWSGGTAPTSPAIGETDVLTFNTTDGGTTYQAVQAINGAK